MTTPAELESNIDILRDKIMTFNVQKAEKKFSTFEAMHVGLGLQTQIAALTTQLTKMVDNKECTELERAEMANNINDLSPILKNQILPTAKPQIMNLDLPKVVLTATQVEAENNIIKKLEYYIETLNKFANQAFKGDDKSQKLGVNLRHILEDELIKFRTPLVPLEDKIKAIPVVKAAFVTALVDRVKKEYLINPSLSPSEGLEKRSLFSRFTQFAKNTHLLYSPKHSGFLKATHFYYRTIK